MNATRICSIEHCTTPTRRKELCDAHYRRKRLHGDPLATKRPGLGISLADRLDLYTDKSDGCWLWTGGGTRYGKTVINGKTVSAHVAAYQESFGAIPSGMVVRHKCDTPKCVRPSHLELGTNADNSRDMTDRERQARGERQWCAKMTAESVADLREAYESGAANIPQLARNYGLSTSTVGKIVNYQTWKHVLNRKAA